MKVEVAELCELYQGAEKRTQSLEQLVEDMSACRHNMGHTHEFGTASTGPRSYPLTRGLPRSFCQRLWSTTSHITTEQGMIVRSPHKQYTHLA